ncbi:nucleotide exchange factor GrpE [Rhodobacteraceae bacterium RKSG542]|uniref:nucleotide exchange factor GrpE n=1 Tax=Pseudovibrio flavus TaxID=2529854 RepID=UPI0012BC0C66|nr:nucleotide exchange factor GrpE [Pseudovibrio flavus]MTI17799.1 nucleotide exchange factor GrpE [Pseudovibrio flavus]
MTDQGNNPTPEDAPVPPMGADAPEAEAAAAAEAQAAENPVDALMAENADLKDKMLRVMAEMENLRRRTEKEVRDAKSYAISSFARDMLVVNDNLNRAIDAIPAEERQAEGSSLKVLSEGVEMVERDLLNQLEKHGVKRLTPEGEKFNPHFHQAMFEVPNTEVPNNTVVQVVQAGYVIGDRVLRPAMVGVSKGGPKVAPGTEPGANLDKDA